MSQKQRAEGDDGVREGGEGRRRGRKRREGRREGKRREEDWGKWSTDPGVKNQVESYSIAGLAQC